MFPFNTIHRYSGAALLVAVALAVSAGAGSAHADPGPVAPPPPPVIGPLQYGPPGYPAAIGVPLLPQGRSGVSISADTVDPAVPNPVPTNTSRGISGVQTSADSLSPIAASSDRP
ncbi:Uncharacterised protein [Mycobacteroides abscessus subsp. bolletii]|uniref:hypothetical protein n=1 Tax=Mycobacteroides abscessus TaxID=36809 RepID=UPI0009A8D7DA|nr:hypothetical protein [Mycobacteroides abscessus]SKG56982.1 Uncharacterised protein [Mycobacteroides abscessus subsp. bolletii]SKU90478.1 Uncharacterised protein [Mycobacteroides abscessus subsp. bolletii]SLF01790.1 Uncharacterised protein [Mycobacteroides abscessus subsp. bolletii]